MCWKKSANVTTETYTNRPPMFRFLSCFFKSFPSCSSSLVPFSSVVPIDPCFSSCPTIVVALALECEQCSLLVLSLWYLPMHQHAPHMNQLNWWCHHLHQCSIIIIIIKEIQTLSTRVSLSKSASRYWNSAATGIVTNCNERE